MTHIRRFDHVGITVVDLDTVTDFFVALGLRAEGRMFVEGVFLDTVIGIPDSRTEIVMLHAPVGDTTLELSSFVRPGTGPGSPAAMATEPGLRNVAFEVDNVQAAVTRVAADGYRLIGGIGEYEGIWRMAYVRGPEGIIVSLAERLGVEQSTPWDFAAALESLLALQGGADAWHRWDDLAESAESLVATARSADPQRLRTWLDEHAGALIGQQLLVRSVHRDRDTPGEMTEALQAWLDRAGPSGTTDDALAWLRREEPALLRAWLLEHLDELVEREVGRLRSGHDAAGAGTPS